MAGTRRQATKTHQQRPLADLFEQEPDRVSRLGFDVAGLHFDWSKTHLDDALLAHFAKLAEEVGFSALREALFAGEAVNISGGWYMRP